MSQQLCLAELECFGSKGGFEDLALPRREIGILCRCDCSRVSKGFVRLKILVFAHR